MNVIQHSFMPSSPELEQSETSDAQPSPDVMTTVEAEKLQRWLRTGVAGDRANRIAKCRAFFGVEPNGPDDTLAIIAFLIDLKYDFDFCLDVNQLDEFADGEISDDLRYGLGERGWWFDDFLAILNWWRSVSEVLLGSTEAGDDLRPEPAFSHHRQALVKLMGDVMEAFVPAIQEGHTYSGDWMNVFTASQELVKRYRLYTRYVCAFAQELFPDVNMERLLKLS